MLIGGSSALVASLIYLFASLKLWQKIQTHNAPEVRGNTFYITAVAVLMHAFSLQHTLLLEQHLIFHLGNMLSLIMLLSATILLFTNFNKPTETLGIFIFPLAALSTMLPQMLQEQTPLPLELGSHVLISISAYSIMGLATAQAVLYSVQEKRFRTRKLSTLMRALPPLQVMEKTLIQLVVIGFVFLSFALLSGAFFVEDMFAQHLIHKTFFAILSWLLYAIFLFGHFQYGWRGQKAVRYIIWAYVLLVLSYIGTQIILLAIYG
ncbi:MULTISPECIES: cytochrome C assembly family protein [Thiomicrorhabdus]|uniref:Cytochrome c biogenesis protein CcsA n=1 Tax=Thiomicrorhabdus heinhorstiae TaxID=2748010 RepID=A0ABS0BTP1_9GAMM|nr:MULTISPECIES: cytochrome c biogenesis protein CcsA [Thiomicrorhabdus]MBF6057206.1 cytochrome c biogenesis protein CcsA [Thiomicrorhabdus heinhorstiae]